MANVVYVLQSLFNKKMTHKITRHS